MKQYIHVSCDYTVEGTNRVLFYIFTIQFVEKYCEEQKFNVVGSSKDGHLMPLQIKRGYQIQVHKTYPIYRKPNVHC